MKERELAARPKRHPGISRQQLIDLLVSRGDGARVTTSPAGHDVGPVYSGVTNDSRKVKAGDVYCALPGTNQHGAAFYRHAVAAGAVAVITDDTGERMITENQNTVGKIPVFVVDDPRAVAALVAAEIYGTQSWAADKPLFAVTGTNGKTTTSYFINSLLTKLGKTPGLFGTIEISVGRRKIPSVLTTPEAVDIHAYMRVMAEAGANALSMEVSSHALELNRVDHVRFSVAGFTNLTQDHLDFHGSMEEYFQSKARLFAAERTGKAVISIGKESDSSWARQLCIRTEGAGLETVLVLSDPRTMLPTGVEASARRIWTTCDVVPQGWGYRFRLTSNDGQNFDAETALPGLFNVSNAALALAMVNESGFFTAEEIAAALEEKPFSVEVPGRMHMIAEKPAVIIDFAHNPAAMERVFESFADLADDPQRRKVIVVFGATGQRDRLKRPIMGEIAASYADTVIVTDDDPHDESAAQIRHAVLAGVRKRKEELEGRGTFREVFEVAPREKAIETAIRLARPQDVVLILGRGHEAVQDVAGVDVELDDRQVARQVLERRRCA